ncbi:MAG TPA: hypothetical protein VGJ95_23745 [Pseudonocardiaceae bacterium]|jgi:hypothetical protein
MDELHRQPELKARAENPAQEERLPPYLVSGNRFASAGLPCAIVGFVCSLTAFLQFVGWISAATGATLAAIGFVKYCRGGATNRDAAVVGALLAWVALVILLTRASVPLQIPMTPI